MTPSDRHIPHFRDLAGAYRWLDGHINYERKLGQIDYDARAFDLTDFARRLETLGAPQRDLRTVHLAGSRGKGSTAAALEALIAASGRRTAVYASPHLREYRERIRIDGAPLAPDVFTRLLQRISTTAAPALDDPRAHRFKTVFENLTALFFLATREADVDWTVVETGLGGRLDATNVLEPGPVALTRIGLEHTHLLGSTFGAIAAEKAAILKSGGWGVGGAQAPGGEARRVFEAHARQTDAPLTWAEALVPIRAVEAHPEGLTMRFEFEGAPFEVRARHLLGGFQSENIQTALAVCAELRRRDDLPRVAATRLAEALERLRLPGRMERLTSRLPGRPELIVDGAHCPTAAAALADAMRAHFGRQPAGLAVAMMDDKDHDAFFAALARWDGWRGVDCYPGSTPRAADPERLAHAARRHFEPVRVWPSLETLLEALPREAARRGLERVVAAGSLYSVAAFEDWAVADRP